MFSPYRQDKQLDVFRILECKDTIFCNISQKTNLSYFVAMYRRQTPRVRPWCSMVVKPAC